ncbi:MAG TPA: hypothetical protein VL053_16170 [Arachidicoccus sp.]|nr:hypothetical protein [Arachidicoccus sp.]
METLKTKFEKTDISTRKVQSLISQLLGNQGYPDPDNPLPSGPWDPYIRKAAKRIRLFGPSPEPWLYAHLYNLHPEIWDLIHPHTLSELNPQPLPPRFVVIAALTQEVIDHALLLQEIKDAMRQNNNERGIIIVSGDIEKFTDEFEQLCPLIGIILNIRPGKGDGGYPHPNWANEKASAIEAFVASAVFHQNALNTFNQGFRQSLQDASTKLAELSISLL